MDEMIVPALRHGLLGLCGLQLGVGVWLMRIVLVMARDMTRVVEANTAAVQALVRRGAEDRLLAADLRDRLIARPCLGEAARGRAAT